MDACSVGPAELARAAFRAARNALLRPPCVWLLVLSFLDVPSAGAQSESPWGVSPSAALSYNPREWARGMADAGVRWVRGFRNGADLEGALPMRELGISVCGILMWSPQSPQRFPVNDLPGWKRYVTDRVTKYRGVVTHWEVWNEPPNFTDDKSPASYGKVVAAAYDAAKAVDPNVKIGLAAKSVHLQFMAEAIRAGAKDKFDFVTFHPYEMAGLLSQGWEGPYLGIVANVRAMLKELSPAKANAPVWFTEVGLEVSDEGASPFSEEEQADALIKLYVMGLAQGVAHIHWFDPRDSEGRSLGLLRPDSSPKPAYNALRELTRALGVKPKFLGYVPLGPNTFGFLFAGPERDVLVAWTKPGQCRLLMLSEPVSVLYPELAREDSCQNVSLDQRALLLSAPVDSAVAKTWRSERSATRPVWDSGSERTSATLHAGLGPLGIHAVGPVDVRCHDGRCEYDLSARKELRFAVDPMFQGFAGQALEVIMTLRPHGSADAGFNLKYESTGPDLDDHGMRRAGGWSNVRGTRPVTLRWKISNPSFVGKYGAHLSVDCDSVRYCNFGIMSVIINKAH